MSHPSAVIEGLYLPPSPESFYTSRVNTLQFGVEPNGIVGDSRHSGNTTLADVRTPAYTRNKDTVLNRQSVSFVAGEDLDYIAAELGIDGNLLMDERETSIWSPEYVARHFLARCLGANVLLGGFRPSEEVSAFRELAPGTDFGPYDPETRKFTDATVMITRTNEPCMPPGRKIQELYPGRSSDLAQRFVNVAQGRRGFVGMVAKGGEMSMGQTVHFVPLGSR